MWLCFSATSRLPTTDLSRLVHYMSLTIIDNGGLRPFLLDASDDGAVVVNENVLVELFVGMRPHCLAVLS